MIEIQIADLACVVRFHIISDRIKIAFDQVREEPDTHALQSIKGICPIVLTHSLLLFSSKKRSYRRLAAPSAHAFHDARRSHVITTSHGLVTTTYQITTMVEKCAL